MQKLLLLLALFSGLLLGSCSEESIEPTPAATPGSKPTITPAFVETVPGVDITYSIYEPNPGEPDGVILFVVRNNTASAQFLRYQFYKGVAGSSTNPPEMIEVTSATTGCCGGLTFFNVPNTKRIKSTDKVGVSVFTTASTFTNHELNND